MRFLAIISILFLAACLPVDDFGSYWNKGTVDPALKGMWLKTSGPGYEPDVKKTMRFTERDGAYTVDLLAGKKNQQMSPVKTIDVGPYHFLAGRDPEKGSGMIVRYLLKGDTLTFYALNDHEADGFIKKNYAVAKNIGADSAGGSLTIKVFDDEVYKILSTIPEDQTYWNVLEVEQKVKE